MLPEHVAAISLERAEKAHARALKNPGRIPAKRLVVVVPGFWNTVLAFLSRVLPRRATYRAAARRDQM
jgi:hypothetical protein